MWTLVKHARRYGFDVRKTGQGWQYGRVTINGVVWRPFHLLTRQSALAHAYYVYTDGGRP